jgi:hypothetical protein
LAGEIDGGNVMDSADLLTLAKANNEAYIAAYRAGYTAGYKDAADRAIEIIKRAPEVAK